MSEFKVIETQEQLEEVLRERLRRERETTRKEYEGYLSPEEVAKMYGKHLSPEDAAEKYKNYISPEEAEKLQTKLKGYESDSVKTRIAQETGLAYEAVQFLKGDNEEEIRKSAEMLKGLMGAAVAPLASTEQKLPNAKDVALRNTLKGLKGE